MTGRLFCVVGILLYITLSITAFSQSQRFTDVTKEAGIDFKYNFGDYTYGNILESSGSGITVLDYDLDGDLDLLMLNGTYIDGISDPEGKIFQNTTNTFYRNNGDGTFSDVTEKTGIVDTHWSMAASTADFDADGDLDIFLLNYGPNVFYRNNGDGTFTNITSQTGLQGPESLNGFEKWSVGAVFWDFNNDNRLDVMVGNFLAFDPEYKSPTAPDVMPHPSEYKGQASMLYRQEPDGSFTDVTEKTALYFPDSKCMGLTVFDYDQDGDNDLFQGNDHQRNFLFRNDGNAIFTEVGLGSGLAVNDQGDPTGSMHGSIGDVDGDGLIDMLVTDLKYGALYRNLGKGVFEDITVRSGVAEVFRGKGQWAASLFDFDNDGDLDIYSANGTAEELILQPPIILENNGRGNYRNVRVDGGEYFKSKRSGRGGVVWDYDNDGDMDVIISHVDLKATPVLLRNDSKNGNHWLGITIEGSNGPAAAVGATIIVRYGSQSQIAVNQWNTSYLSSNDPRIHFGLGESGFVDSIEIRWSDGTKESYSDIAVDQYVTIKQGSGKK
jgi:hypothetical protein